MVRAARRLLVIAMLPLAGCATYTTPAGPVNVVDLANTEPELAAILAREPTAKFPARIAVVRAQASDYRRYDDGCYGNGYYCVITSRDVEDDSDFERLSGLPMIAGIAPMNRIIVPEHLQSLDDLRTAAAQLRADMILLYTFDTRFHVEARDIGPLQTISLGFFRNRKAHVATTASLALYDVRTGYLYGLAEATAREDQRASLWSTDNAIETARRSTEQQSFTALLDEFNGVWKDVVETHALPVVPAVAID
ncbi:MAG: hypothetical protein AAFX44_09485 [Pseudomonadota bacterium]